MRQVLIIGFLYLILSQNVMGQAIPRKVDVSFLGDFRVFSHNIEGSIRKGKPHFQLSGFETYITGYLNPYARGTMMVAIHGHQFEVEEAFADLNRLLPWGLSIKAGKYQVNFGRIALLHPHAYPFMEYPIIHRIYGGFHAYNDLGVQINWMLPIDLYTNLSFNILQGNWLAHSQMGHEHEEDANAHIRGTESPVFTTRFNTFWELSETANLDIGLSGLYGIYRGKNSHLFSGGDDLYAAMGCLDLKYKWRPDDYTSLVIVGEGVLNHRELPSDESVVNWGFVAYTDLQFRRRYNIGIKIDYAPGIFDYQGSFDWDIGPEHELNNTNVAQFDDRNNTWAVSAFAGFSLMEETTLFRILLKYQGYQIDDLSLLNNPDLAGKEDEWLYALQMVFSLGPHKPHEF